jgi:micrococcal nuclease
MYQYNARVVRWIDGDTVVMDVDLGFFTWLKDQHFRLASVGCPELNTPEGQAAAARARELAPAGTLLIVDTQKHKGGQLGRSFTRWLTAAIRLNDGRDLSTVLLSEGHATPYQK